MQSRLTNSEPAGKKAALQARLAAIYADVGRDEEAISLLQPLCEELDDSFPNALAIQSQLADMQVCCQNNDIIYKAFARRRSHSESLSFTPKSEIQV